MQAKFAVATLLVAMAVGGCSLLESLGPGPSLAAPLPADPLYQGDDAATLVIATRQVGCCYIEGSQRYALLEGPTTVEWAVDDGSGNSDDLEDFLVGRQHLQIQPGNYVLTEWERICNGNCAPEFIGDPRNGCSTDLEVGADSLIEIVVVFRIHEAGSCSMEVVGDVVLLGRLEEVR